MNIADVNEAFGILEQRRRLLAIQSSPDHRLSGVGDFPHDPDAVTAVLPAYAAFVATRIADIEDRLRTLGVDLPGTDADTSGDRIVRVTSFGGEVLEYRVKSDAQPTAQPEAAPAL